MSQAQEIKWQHSLFDCLDNPYLCIIAHFCPCVVLGNLSRRLGEPWIVGFCIVFVPIFNCVAFAIMREMLMDAKGMPKNRCKECCRVLVCPFLTLVQEANEDYKPPENLEIART